MEPDGERAGLRRFPGSALKKTLGIVLLLGGLAGALLFFLRPSEVVVSAGSEARDQAHKASRIVNTASGAPSPAAADFVKSEAGKIGQVDSNPEATQQRLNAWAHGVSAQGAKELSSVALDASRSQDERFLAAYLLGMVPQAEAAIPALREVALAPWAGPGMGEKHQDRVNAIEVQVRAAAIEGLARHRGQDTAREALVAASRAHQEQFLTDRAQRALHEWRTGATVEDQDRKALGKVLQR